MNKVGGMIVIAIAGVATLAMAAISFASDKKLPLQEDGFKIAVDAQGNISLPSADIRKDWVSLGMWSIAADDSEPGAQGIHTVYTQRESVESYRETGKFPDGAVLIKELLSTITEEMTTGTVSRASETEGWFVMVKDSQDRFPQSGLWGDGWGWAYFDADNPTETTTTDYEAECKGCHIPAEGSDWIYIAPYHVLNGR
jgi:Cytochrome P460